MTSCQINLNVIRKKHVSHKIRENSIIPHFEEIEEALISYIIKSSYVVGCAAWLTNSNIIDSLISKKGVKIIVNKESFLSEKLENGRKNYWVNLRKRYDLIPDIDQDLLNNITKILEIDKISNQKGSVLTCGIVSDTCRMHHKFLVFFDENKTPYAVWTGSYNFSQNSNRCLENGIFTTDQFVVQQYLLEFCIVYSRSEHHNWVSGALKSYDKKQ